MNLIVKQTERLEGEFKAPPSKSHTHRAIIVASLADGKSIIRNPLMAGDTMATINACKLLGADIRRRGNDLLINGTGGNLRQPEKYIDVCNSGTTLRFMTAVSALLGDKVVLTGDESVKKRPMEPLLDALESLGAETKSRNGYPPVKILGKIKGGKAKIRGDISSQYISALLIAGLYAEEPVKIEMTGELVSKPYIQMTLDVLEKAKAKIYQDDGKLMIQPGKLRPIEMEVDGDFSSSSYILAAAALLPNSRVKAVNLSMESSQADKQIIRILDGMGADVSVERDHIFVRAKELRGTAVKASDFPDLVPTIAALACYAEGETRISGIEHLRFKETDRISAIGQLSMLGAKMELDGNNIVMRGCRELKGCKLDSYGDHRMVMALSVAGLKANGTTVISNAESIRVSFSDFVDVMRGLGAKMKIA